MSRVAATAMLAALLACVQWPAPSSRSELMALPAEEAVLVLRDLPDRDVDALARFEELSWLEFAPGESATRCSLTDEGLARLAALHLPYLQVLRLHDCLEVTDQGLGSISRIRSLKWVSAGGPALTDAGVRSLTTLPELECLSLECPQLTEAGVQSIAENLPRLQALELRYCERVGSFASLRHLRDLRGLVLADFPVGAQALEELATLDQLEELDLSRTGVSRDTLEELARRLPGCKVTDYEVREHWKPWWPPEPERS